MAQHSEQELTKMRVLPSLSTISRHTSKSSTTSGFGEYTCVLKGYSTILSLAEIKQKAANFHQVDVPREKKIACFLIFISLILCGILSSIYYVLLLNFDYELHDKIIVGLEIGGVMSTLTMGMCLLRWCSLNDVSPKTIWDRVAVKQASPLKLIKFDMENVDITYYEYNINYGQYPHKLHEPKITLTEREKICSARDLIKITKKEPDPDQAYSYGAIYFHYKGKDEYLLDRWNYEFEKYHTKVRIVYKKCNKFHSAFSRHFGWKYKYYVVEEDDDEYNAPKQEQEENVEDIKENDIEPPDEEDNFDDDEIYMNTHDDDESISDIVQFISPILLAKATRNGKDTKNDIQYNSVRLDDNGIWV